MNDSLHDFFLTVLIGVTAFALLKCLLTLARRKWPVQLKPMAWDWLLVILSVLAGPMAT
jgi:hypothetical protein